MSDFSFGYEMLGDTKVRKFSVGDYVPPVEPDEDGDYMLVNATYVDLGSGSYKIELDKTWEEIDTSLKNGIPVWVSYIEDIDESSHQYTLTYVVVTYESESERLIGLDHDLNGVDTFDSYDENGYPYYYESGDR